MKSEKKKISIGDRATYFYIKNLKKWMFCPSCKNGKMSFNKKTSHWVCEDCGYGFSEEYFLDDCVFWFCDECETYLNSQEGFDKHSPKHICRNCGYENDTTFDNIKGTCSDCGKLLPNPDGTLCADCRQSRREKAKQWLITAGKVAAGVAVVVGAAVIAASAIEDDENTDYTPLPGGDDERGLDMKFSHVTDSWMQTASEDELRDTCREMERLLDELDYESEEHTQISNIHIDVVNAIASRFPLNLPHREHGWYLPNDDD